MLFFFFFNKCGGFFVYKFLPSIIPFFLDFIFLYYHFLQEIYLFLFLLILLFLFCLNLILFLFFHCFLDSYLCLVLIHYYLNLKKHFSFISSLYLFFISFSSFFSYKVILSLISLLVPSFIIFLICCDSSFLSSTII
jgi:hypothetical protein